MGILTSGNYLYTTNEDKLSETSTTPHKMGEDIQRKKKEREDNAHNLCGFIHLSDRIIFFTLC